MRGLKWDGNLTPMHLDAALGRCKADKHISASAQGKGFSMVIAINILYLIKHMGKNLLKRSQ